MNIDDKLLNQLALNAQESPLLRTEVEFSENPEAKVQELIKVLMPGTIVPIHRHRQTSETTMILRGKLFVVFYNEMGGQIERHLLDPAIGNYGVQIPKGQWHSVELIEPSAILEVKDGPYMPLEPEDMMD